MTTITAALQAYRTSQGLAGPGGGREARPSPDADFGKMVKDALGGVVEQGRTAEQMSMKMAAGQASIVDVVSAIAETEVALETMVSVRDRVIAAYEDVMRMPI